MLIEFTGCTGSGKTTISDRVIQKLSCMGVKTIAVHPQRFYVLGMRLKNETLQNIVRDLVALPVLMLTLNRHRPFLRFAIRVLRRNADSFLIGLNLFRSVIRKIGTYELMKRRSGNDEVVILDEGTVHSAHNLLVHLTSPCSTEEVRQLAMLVPLPDIIVCVKAPKSVLLERTFVRKDRPRRSLSELQLQTFVYRAYDLFEQLPNAERIRDLVLAVEYPEDSTAAADALRDQIVDHILNARRCRAS